MAAFSGRGFGAEEVLDEIFAETSGEDSENFSSEGSNNCIVSAKTYSATGTLSCMENVFF